MSSLIENLGDLAVAAILRIIEGLVCDINEQTFLIKADKHKKREVGMLLMGVFTEDIQMYANRENVDLIVKLGQILASMGDQPQ